MTLDTLLVNSFSLIKASVIILSVLYFIFSLIVIRQVNLMTETLITSVSPALRVFALFHTLLSLGVVIFLILTL